MNLYKSPRWIVLQLLEQCNLRCKMCYEWGEHGAYKKTNKRQLDIRVLKKLVEDCSDYTPYYDLFGGEPLLYKDLEELLEIINYYNSAVDIPTNGVLLKEKAEMLLKNPPNRIWVSLDGPQEINDAQRGKGVYKAAVEGIDTLLDLRNSKNGKKSFVGVSCIVTPNNYLFIEDFFMELLKERNLDQISIEMQLFSSDEQCSEYGKVLKQNFGVDDNSYARGMIWDVKEFADINIEELVRQIKAVKNICEKKNIFMINYPKTVDADNYKNYFSGNFTEMLDNKKRCMLPWTYVEITANGDVAPCHTYYDLTFGNLYDRSLLDIWSSPQYAAYREYMKSHILPICTSCSRYYAYNKKNDIIG